MTFPLWVRDSSLFISALFFSTFHTDFNKIYVRLLEGSNDTAGVSVFFSKVQSHSGSEYVLLGKPCH